MTPKPRITNTLVRPYPLPYERRGSHKSWDPDLHGQARWLVMFHHQDTRKGQTRP